MVNDIVWYRDEQIIRDLIQDYESDPKRQEMIDGQRYYENEGDILTRQQYFWNASHEKQIDDTRPNNRVNHAFMKLLVDEKIGYFLGISPNVTAENAQFQEKLITIFDEEFDDILNDVGVEASNKGIAWLYVYLGQPERNEKAPLLFELVPSEQVVPIWEDRAHSRLSGLINYYYLTEFDIETGKQEDVLKVECWHPEGVIFYTEFDGHLVEDIARMFPDLKERSIPETGLPHFMVNGKAMNWHQIPFIPFRNNSRELNDLRFVRSIIDAYDKSVSDWANILEDLKRLILIIKNYQGTDLNEFMDNLRYFGAIKVDDDGGVDKLDLSFSPEGINSFLDRMKKDFYQFGQGVDMDTDKFGANPSGVALEFLYSGLKLKTDNLERKFKFAYKQLFRMVCQYLSVIGEGSYDWKLAKVTFNRSVVTNVLEQIDAVIKSSSVISHKTAIAHHPWVDDVDLEIQQISQDERIDLDRVPVSGESRMETDSEEQDDGSRDGED